MSVENGGAVGAAAHPPQIFAKVNLLPVDNYSEKKKKNSKKNTHDFKFLENYW